jgi:hypothetical protein
MIAITCRLPGRGAERQITERQILKRKFPFCFPVYSILCAVLICNVDRASAQSPADIRRVLDGKMLPGEEVATFERSDLLYPATVVKRGSTIRPLPPVGRQLKNVNFQIGNKKYDLFDYLSSPLTRAIPHPSRSVESGKSG